MKKIDDGLTNSQRYARRHAAKGLCSHCNNPRLIGNKMCISCLEKKKDYHKRKRKNAETIDQQRQQDIPGLPIQGQ